MREATRPLAPSLQSPKQAGTCHGCWQAERYSEGEDRGKHPPASWPAEGAIVRGYVVVFEGNDGDGYSAYSPDLPGVVAAGSTRQETEQLMIEAMGEHIALLRESGEPVPEPSDSDSVTVLNPSAA